MILKNGKRLDSCSDTVPIGTINPYIGSIAPYGYLICEGQLVSKTTYKELYEICGDKFGTGTETEFRLPDLRGKTIVGYKEGDSTFGTLGGLLGSLTHIHTTGNHTLTIDEMPGHTHARGTMEITGTFGITTRYSSGDMNSRTNGAFKFNHEDGKAAQYAQSNPNDEGGSVSFKASDSWTGDSSWNGGSQAHNHGNTGESSNLQPSLTMNWIVKAFLLMPNQSYVENSLTSSSEINSLSAAKGKELNDKINALNIPTVNNTLTSTSTTQALSAAQGKVLNDRLGQLENYKNGETVIGTWTDGKPLYRYITNTTKKDLGTILNSLHIKYLKSTNGSYVTSKWNNSWAIPTAYNPEPDYNLWVMGGNTPGENVQINFGAYYTDSSAVRLVIEYTKTTD